MQSRRGDHRLDPVSLPIVATYDPDLIFTPTWCVHLSFSCEEAHLTVRLWHEDYFIGTAHINFVDWDRDWIELAKVSSMTVGFPPKLLRGPDRQF